MKIKDGDKFPEFKMINQDGEEVTLSDFSGKYLAIFIYPKDSTPGCTTQACQFRDYESELLEYDCQVVGISGGTLKSHQNFKEKNNLSFDLLLDEEFEFIKKIGAWAERSMFGNKFWGVQRSSVLLDPEGNIIKVWDKISPKKNVPEVIKTLKSVNS